MTKSIVDLPLIPCLACNHKLTQAVLNEHLDPRVYDLPQSLELLGF